MPVLNDWSVLQFNVPFRSIYFRPKICSLSFDEILTQVPKIWRLVIWTLLFVEMRGNAEGFER